MTTPTPRPTWSPFEIAHALGDLPPTAQQADVIAADLTPRLVVAGAGSGKTTTMADRVAWLVVNGHVLPEEVLGVTFTRKAAGELADRIGRKLRALRRAGLWRPGAASAAAGDENAARGEETTARGEETAAWEDEDPLAGAEPTVSTYHSYANSLVRSYGLRLGVEADTVLLGQAQTWQLAQRIVAGWDGPLPSKLPAASTLTAGVVKLAAEVSEHLVAPEQILDWAHRTRGQFLNVPPAGRKKTAGKAKGAVDNLEITAWLAELVHRFRQAKTYEGALDYGDLLGLAAELVRVDARARAAERSRYKVVLLDEFQDTSHAQLELFSGLFGDGHCVMAVGDPQQSIYGFRGASSGQLFSFVENFPIRTPATDHAPAEARFADTSFLTVAWRNSRAVLAAANAVAQPLRTPPPWQRSTSALEVPPLDEAPTAGEGTVRVSRYLTDGAEAGAVAEAIAQRRAVHSGQPEAEMPTMAVLCRRRAQFEPLRLELEARDIPYEVVGLGGLLHTPEVADIVASLYVLTDPGRSDALARLLCGPRWRIGPHDLAALGDWAQHLALRRRRDAAAGHPEADVAGIESETPDPGAQREPTADAEHPAPAPTVVESDAVDHASLIEALESLPSRPWSSPRGRRLSETALSRLREAREVFRALRAVLGDELTTVLHDVETALGLDIELASHPGIPTARQRQNLDSFTQQAVQFTATTRSHDVAAFLGWLEAAAHEENALERPPQQARHDAVQLLTVHAAKGLEWDHVYVPGMNQGDFPGAKKDNWTKDPASLPWPLRGDAQHMPQWDVDLSDLKAFEESYVRFTSEDVPEHELAEERRLAYVAFTRAKHVLELSGSVFRGTAKHAKAVSPFLAEIRDAALAGQLGVELGPWAEVDEGTLNPQADTVLSAPWPYDPLEGPRITRRERDTDGAETVTVTEPVHAGRRAVMTEAAQAVLAGGFSHTRDLADAALLEGPHGERIQRWRRDADLLLTSREATSAHHTVHLPAHVSASAIVEMAEDPRGYVDRLRRPMPRRPGSAARTGTAFHAWVEEYFGSSAIFDADELPGADDHVDHELDLPRLADTFRASRWAQRQPYAVELPVETPVGPVTVRGRIDAVFRTDDGGWELVDWKTGRVPRGEELERKAGQLAVYRLAFSRWHGIPLEDVSALFYYVAQDREVRPHDMADAAELEAVITALFAADPPES